jgi:hypothetical protein
LTENKNPSSTTVPRATRERSEVCPGDDTGGGW